MLHLGIETAIEMAEDPVLDWLTPEEENAFDWQLAREILFQDTDFLAYYNTSIGDQLKKRDDWFKYFGNTGSRDYRRGYRR